MDQQRRMDLELSGFGLLIGISLIELRVAKLAMLYAEEWLLKLARQLLNNEEPKLLNREELDRRCSEEESEMPNEWQEAVFHAVYVRPGRSSPL